MAGLGSERATLKGDAEEGRVELQIGDDEYARTLTRRGDAVEFTGTPYLEDATVADLFAFLLENNEARQAVARGDDLRELIMRPVDTDRIEAEIQRLEAEKRDVDDRLEELERIEDGLADLRTERANLEASLDDARAELESVEAEIATHDVSIEESQSQREAIEAAFDALREARAELEDVEFEIDAERQRLEELESERTELRERLAETEAVDEDPERLAGRIEELRRRKRSVEDTLSQLGSVIGFNEEMLEGEGLDLEGLTDDGSGEGGESITDQLVADPDELVCWTCGSDVERGRIETTVDRLRSLRQEKLEERADLREEIDSLSATRAELEERARERERIERRLSEIDDEIDETDARLDDLEGSRRRQRDAVDRLEADAEAAGTDERYDEVLELHRRSNELELRIDRLEDDLDDVDERIADRERETDEREDLTERREGITEELTDLRTRVDRIETESVEAFNQHMAAVLDVLEYENIERIWIDRREREVREGRRKVTRSVFDLKIVRSTTEGASYRDTVDHLSESEREVTGLTFALAGYLVHEVYEELPVMILDSLEAIDSDRIGRVIEYFSDYVDYLVVALLPEDARALPGEYTYVERID
jgi:chromosome segregation ATPase